MEFNSLFFTNDIINIIFEGLSHHDKITFSHINQYTYHNYHNKCKYLLFDHLNKDYKCFKEWMKRYTYTENELQEIGIVCISDIGTVWESPLTCYYDIRYIFELIYAGLDYNNKEIKDRIQHLNLFLIMTTIKKCISFNRFETIHKINQEVMLRPLHRLFSPIHQGSRSWEYI